MASANIIKDIRKAKAKLVLKAKAKGIYENFGREECSILKDKWDKYINSFPDSAAAIQQQLDGFFDWCINFDQNDLEKER